MNGLIIWIIGVCCAIPFWGFIIWTELKDADEMIQNEIQSRNKDGYLKLVKLKKMSEQFWIQIATIFGWTIFGVAFCAAYAIEMWAKHTKRK